MSESGGGSSPPAMSGSSPPASGAGNETNKNTPTAPSPTSTSTSSPPPPPDDSSNNQSSSEKKSAETSPPPAPQENESPPPPSSSSTPSSSKPPPSPQTPKQQQSPPATPQTQNPPKQQQQKHQSPPAPNTHSKESSQSSSGSSSSSSSSSPDNSTKSSPSPPRPSPGTSQSQSSANSTSSSPQISSSAPANGSSTTSSSTSSPKALGPTTLSTSKSPSSNSSDGSSPSGGSNNSKQNNVGGHDKTLNYEGVIAATVVGVLVVVFIILFFYLRGRKKNRKSPYANYNRPPSTNFLVTSVDFNNYLSHTDAQVGHSPQHDTFHYNSQLHGQESSMVNSPQKEQNYHGPDSGIMAGSKTYFTYEELMEMTNGFARQNIIGEGGFGCVFKGWMADGRVVAVKQLKAGSGQGEREFRAEVEIISRVHHRHLVSLVGYSMAEKQRLLIYEFVPNNTLEHHLHAKELSLLEWDKRVKIALGAAKGLAYLHEDCMYLAPEYASSGKLTDRSDVYSFGVVLLELITGRKPIDSTQPLGDEGLVEWARPLLIQALESGDFGELIDPRLKKHYVKSEMVRMVEAAAACVRHSSSKRPRMALVVRALDFEGDPDLSNGVKYGDSIAYDSGKYSEEIAEFRRMGLSSTENSSEIDMYSSEYNSKEMERGQSDFWKSQNSSGDYTSGELETRALKTR
ncbi:hypothetical protein Gotri_022733 [Gossypium trilobum]|uniref:non-specific serine/threonine protein kinase n=1 Tax=Gossypium trilobum TaxID=34281 RepID=A0A7J9DGU0_9ROSI|nr:hypothetical protein [Gossypium trilobum]